MAFFESSRRMFNVYEFAEGEGCLLSTMDGEEQAHIVFLKARSIRCTVEWEESIGIPTSPTRTVPNFTYPPPMRGAAGPRAHHTKPP